MNQVAQMMLNQLKAKNPKAFQQFESLMNNKGDPQQLLRQVTQGYTPEQIKQFSQFANNFGITNAQLSEVGIISK